MLTERRGHLLPVATCPLFTLHDMRTSRDGKRGPNSAVLQPNRRAGRLRRDASVELQPLLWLRQRKARLVQSVRQLDRLTQELVNAVDCRDKLRDRGAKPREEVVYG